MRSVATTAFFTFFVILVAVPEEFVCTPFSEDLLLESKESSKIIFPIETEEATDAGNLAVGQCERHCTPLDFCPTLFQLLEKPTPSNLKRLRNASCGFDEDRNPLVLCEDAICLDHKLQEHTQLTNSIGTRSKGSKSTLSSIPLAELIKIDRSITLNDKGCGETLIDRIQGGMNALRGEFPWLVALMVKSEDAEKGPLIYCGGSLIALDWVLTAAHCVVDETGHFRNISHVRVGALRLDEARESGAYNVQIKKLIPHPHFENQPVILNDIALVRLAEPVTPNSYVGLACLPHTDFFPPASMPVMVAGWGSTDTVESMSPLLQKAELSVADINQCRLLYENFETIITPSQQVCAHSPRADSCKGDSGGPLMTKAGGRTIVIGVTSFGAVTCDGVLPGVYTKVGSFSNWIQDTISKAKVVKTPSDRV